MTAYDQDIYTEPSELASTSIPLSQKYKDMNSRPEGAEVTSYLKQAPKVRIYFRHNSRVVELAWNYFRMHTKLFEQPCVLFVRCFKTSTSTYLYFDYRMLVIY